MAIEALQAELAAAGILKRCPAVELHQCVAGGILVPPDPQQPPPWLAVRSALLATCVLPLASPALHARYDSAWATSNSAACPGACCYIIFAGHLQWPRSTLLLLTSLLDPAQDTCSAVNAIDWCPRQRQDNGHTGHRPLCWRCAV